MAVTGWWGWHMQRRGSESQPDTFKKPEEVWNGGRGGGRVLRAEDGEVGWAGS